MLFLPTGVLVCVFGVVAVQGGLAPWSVCVLSIIAAICLVVTFIVCRQPQSKAKLAFKVSGRLNLNVSCSPAGETWKGTEKPKSRKHGLVRLHVRINCYIKQTLSILKWHRQKGHCVLKRVELSKHLFNLEAKQEQFNIVTQVNQQSDADYSNTSIFTLRRPTLDNHIMHLRW